MTLRVAIVDDHDLFRDGLKAVLHTAGRDLEVVGEANSARTGADVVARTRPDIALIDLALPDGDGVVLARDLVRDQICRVLVVSMHEGAELAREALAAGVQGYAVKALPATELLHAVDVVAKGGRYVAPSLADALASPDASNGNGNGYGNGSAALRSLTARERDVFRLAVRGASNDAIARELHISRKTVETHRARVNTKLDVHSAADLVRFAARHGLLPSA
jgi:DNA-binding NarL/FixJ family response regulator